MSEQLWDELHGCAGDRRRLDERELELIVQARRDAEWDWTGIAEALGLTDGEAAQRRYQELANCRVGLGDLR